MTKFININLIYASKLNLMLNEENIKSNPKMTLEMLQLVAKYTLFIACFWTWKFEVQEMISPNSLDEILTSSTPRVQKWL